MTGSFNTCPVEGCPRSRRTDQVMCRDCWRRVPRELRARIWSLWRNGASAEYLAARNAAIASVEEAGKAGART